MSRRIIYPFLAGLLVAALVMTGGCGGEEETEPEPTHVSTQLPSEGVQLPREVEYATVNTTGRGITEFERGSYGRIVGTYFSDVRTINCEGDFTYTITTVIIFKGKRYETPVRKTVTYTYPPSTDEFIPTDRPYPVFSPMAIVTDYIYEDQENPLPSEYQDSTTSVVIENAGASGDITVIVEDCLITFYFERGERVRVTAHLNEFLPYYRLISIGQGELVFALPNRWEARQTLPGDVCQGEINVDICEDTEEVL